MIIEMSQADSKKPLKMSGTLTLLSMPSFDYDYDSRDNYHRQIVDTWY